MFESKETKKRNGKYWEWDIYKSYKCIISLDICYAKNTRWWCYCVILNTSVVAWVLSNPSWKHSVWAFSSSCFPLPLQHQCAEAPHSIPCVGTKPRWYACMANSRVGLLLWHTSYFIPQDKRKREGFWSCVPSADIIFVMQLLQTVKQSWPSKKIRLFTKWEERDNYKAWNLKALLQKLKVCVSFHYVVFSSIFFLYLLKKVKILFITN